MRHATGQSSNRFHLLRLAQLLLASAQRFFRPLALDHFPQPGNNCCDELDEAFVLLTRLSHEKLDDCDDFTPHHNGERQSRSKPSFCGIPPAWEICIARDVTDPDRLLGSPDLARKSNPGCEREVSTRLPKLLHTLSVPMPRYAAFQYCSIRSGSPRPPEDPACRFADIAQHDAERRVQAVGAAGLKGRFLQ